MSAPLRDNVVVLTGASAGIGRATALRLSERGAALVLAARNRPALEALSVECRGRGAKAALAVPTDVRDAAQCRALIDRTVAELGRVDTLINNAGISMWARFEEVKDLGVFEEILRVNVLGPVHLTHAALPHLKAARGRLVAVCSVAGLNGVPTRTGYAASKHAMVGFFESLRIELLGTGVTVTMLYPDFVASEIRERAFGADGRPLGKGNSPVQEERVMSAEECARRCVDAIAARKRQLFMTPRTRVGRWLKLIAPGAVDQIARRAIEHGR